MFGRVLIILLALLAGAVVASFSPAISASLHRVAVFIGLSGVAQPTRPPAQDARPAQVPRLNENLIRLTDERIAMARIEVAAARRQQLQRHITVPGTIAAAGDRITRVPVKVAGTIAELRKRLGDIVQRGEIVAVIDSREIADVRSEYLTSAVTLDLQRTAYERTQSLWERRVTAEQQYLQARATYQEAQLRHDLARQKLLALGLNPDEVSQTVRQGSDAASRLRQYPVLATASGRIVERRVDVGASVGQQNDPTEIYTVADLSIVWLELAVSMSDVSQLSAGQRVTIPGAEGRIAFVSPLLDPNTRQARVIAEIANPQETLRPGTFVSADIITNDAAVAVAVPRAALQTIGGETVVFVRTPEGFEKRSITPGASDHDFVEIASGLEAGAHVAVTNSFALKAELGRSRIED